MNEDFQHSLLRYRKDHFGVEVRLSRNPEYEGEKVLSVTHNGNQWQSIGLLPDEILKVITALQETLNT
jgi:hypothetical protein